MAYFQCLIVYRNAYREMGKVQAWSSDSWTASEIYFKVEIE